MEFTPLDVSVNLINDRLQFTGIAKEHPVIAIDYTPPLGDGQGYTSLELLLLSLASCAGSSIAVLLRRTKKTITALTVAAHGVRHIQHPTGFQQITLDFQLHSPDVKAEDLKHALHVSEEKLCPVWAMLKGNVEITATYRVYPEPEKT